MKEKFLLFVILFFSIFVQISSNLYAQTNASEILDNFTKVIGGNSEIDKVKNIYSLAECNGPNGKYQTEIHSAGGSKTIFRQIRENKPDYIGLVNGETFWTKGVDVELAGKNEAFAWRSHELQWLAIHLFERFSELKFIGNENFAGKNANKLSATDELGKIAYLFFDSNTNLLLGFTILSPFSEKPETIRLTINEWKKVGKLLLPAKVTFTDKQGDFELNFHKIKINQMDEKVFEIPPKILAIKELLALHNLQRTAHFNRDAKMLVSIMDDNFIEISNGKINKPKKEDLIKRFQSYFEAVTFIEWDDKQPPIFKVSDDSTMAYSIVNKQVRLKTKDGQEELTVFAWTSTFRKIKDKWLMTSITSTKL